MRTHIYAFGSICRGEYDENSDIDLLVCTEDQNDTYDIKKFSVYSHHRIERMWEDGNPFAWHLHLESRLVFASDSIDWLKTLSMPNAYKDAAKDCDVFLKLFNQSVEKLRTGTNTPEYELSCAFLAIRNFSTCYSIFLGSPTFSRRSPYAIEDQIPLDKEIYDSLMRCRILSTRGIGDRVSHQELQSFNNAHPAITAWMEKILIEVNS